MADLERVDWQAKRLQRQLLVWIDMAPGISQIKTVPGLPVER